jgi:hypothetical protein
VEPHTDRGEHASKGDEIRRNVGGTFAHGVGAREERLVVGSIGIMGGAAVETVLEGGMRTGARGVEGTIYVASWEKSRTLGRA